MKTRHILSELIAAIARPFSPGSWRAILSIALALFCVLLPSKGTAAPVDARSRVAVTTANAKSALDRVSGRITSTVQVTLENTGDRALEAPLHAAIHFTAQTGALAGLTVAGASGGLGEGPHGTFFFDLSSQIGAGLAPGAKVTFTLQFTPAKEARVTFETRVFATVNQDPVVNAGGPYAAEAGQEITFDASASSDPEGGALNFAWNFGDGSPAITGASPKHTFATAGAFEVILKVSDPKGAEKVVRIPVTIAPAEPFALARVRTLDGAGLPLGGTTINEVLLAGPERQFSSNGSSGFASLGAGAGNYRWKFSKPGYLDVWRVNSLSLGQVAFVPNPWLAEISPNPVRISPLVDGAVTSARVKLAFTAGAFIQPSDVTLTELNPQSLPFPLPAGWSPLAQFHAGFSTEPTRPGSATLTLPASLVAGTPAVWVKYAPGMFRWETLELLEAPGGPRVSAAISSSGWYALVVPDLGSTAPPDALAGEPLPESTSPLPADGFAASGAVTPAVAAASLYAEKVTAGAVVNFTHPAGPPSGVVFQTRVSETYELSDGTKTRTPDYDTTIFAYQRPAGLRAEFPLRPQVLFGPSELKEALVRVDVLESSAYAGAVFGNSGGQLSKDGVRVVVPPGAISVPQAAELAIYDVQSLSGVDGSPAIAKAFSLSVSDLGGGARFAFFFEGLAPNTHYVLGRIVTDDEGLGITPLERFLSNGSGILASIEPAAGTRLPGVTGPGDYALVQVTGPQGIVQGVARDITGQPAAGLAIRTANQPWLVFSAADGSYITLGAVGPGLITVVDPRDGNAGSTAIDVLDPAIPQTADVTTAPTGPRVASISPANNALNVRAVEPIVVRFTESISPASLTADGIKLRNAATNSDVPAALSLDASNRIATLLPANPLAAGTRHEISVSAGIRDLQNLPIEGSLSFGFTTVPPEARPPGAQLVIFEPGAQNVPAAVLAQLVGYVPGEGSSHVVAHGSAGTADPEVAVILVNETSGETATVLSKVDGSFANFINASEEDFVTATFVNANGTRVAVPATRQLFDDGRVGLYHQGGILEAQSDGGPVQIQIEPQAIKSRNVFKVEPLGLGQLLAFLNNTLPQNATLLGGVRVTVEGDQIQGTSEMSFPVDPSQFTLSPGTPPEEAALALTVARQVEGQTVYQVVDKMRYEDGRVVTNTAPFQGAFGNGVVSPEGLAASFGGVHGALASAAFSLVIMPLFLGEKAVTVTGQVAQLPDSTVSAVQLSLFAEIVLQIFSPIEATAEDAALAFGQMKAVSGALVSFFSEGEVGTVLPGRIQPGLVCAVSDRTGCYNLVMPAFSGGGNLVGTHPRLGRTLTPISFPRLGVGTAGRLRRNVIFATPDSEFFNTAPKLSVGHTPLYPPPGGNATVDLRILSKTTPTVIPIVDEVVSLVPGVTVTNADVTISAIATTNIGPSQTQWRATVTCSKAAVVRLRLTAATEGNTEAATIIDTIEFGGVPPVADNPLAPADKNDKEGPQVLGSFPFGGDTLPPGQSIIIQFSEPVDKAILNDTAAVTVDVALGAKPALDLSADQQTLSISLGALPEVESITLTLGTSIKDLAGNSLDQSPSQSGAQSFSVLLRPGRVHFKALPGVISGGGAAFGGDHLFVLDRAGDGSLKVFKIGAPSDFAIVKEVPLPGPPRDLVFIPQYSFVPKLGATPVTRDLLVVVGGNLGAVTTEEKSTVGSIGQFLGVKDTDTNITFQGQYLRVFDVTDPASPARIASPRITLRESAVTKVRFAAPMLAYLESGADSQFIGLIDLQALIIGYSLTAAQLAKVDTVLPAGGRAGKDLNGDGDYVDAGESVPLPASDTPEFFGFAGALQPTEATTQRIEDFAFESGLLGATLSQGFKLAANGTPTTQVVPPQYRTLLSPSGELSSIAGVRPYAQGARPKRVTILPGVELAFNGVTQLRDIALVSLSPDSDGISKLSVVDISNVVAPVEMRRIRFESELQLGLLQSAILRPDGLIALATTTDVVLLDPRRLTDPNPPAGTLHPAIRGILRGAGTGNFSASESSSGLRAIALGGRNQLVQPPPEFRFVFFPTAAAVVSDPANLKGNATARDVLLKQLQVVGNVRPSRLRGGAGAVPSVDPPSPAAHYHVVVRAHGGAGESIPLALESLNEAGVPVSNKGAGFPPVRAADAGTVSAIRQTPVPNLDAPIPTLRAFRLSDDPKEDEFNLYLSEPIAMLRERVSGAELQQLAESFGKPRAILWSEDKLRVSIDASGASQPIIGAFASEPDASERILRPRASTIAFTLPGGYLLGPNPPPVGGEFAAPGTFGLVDAASGEFRHNTVDIALPSRRMAIEFQRTVNNQDTCHSAFGNGWDFYHNQRVLELRPDQLLPGSASPTVVRSDLNKSIIAGSGDLEFRDGMGRAIVFKKQESVPTAFRQDPLVQELDWPLDTGTCYLPDPNEKGVFDLIFRFQGGEFVRLTPEGMQFWYAKNGRLSRIYDRFPANYHVLEYSERGELRRIIDRSVTTDRFLEVGYYRGGGSADLIPQLDEITSDDAVAGKIARLRDFAGRDVLFEYSPKGLLDLRKGVEVAGANGGFTGRALTRYIRNPATGFVSGVIMGNGGNGAGGGGPNGGTPVVSTTTALSNNGAPVATGATAVGAPVSVNVPVNNSAATAGTNTGSSSTADGAATAVKFDDFRYPKEVTMTGPGAGGATTKTTFNSAGLLERVEYPEGSAIEYTYDGNNPVLRARPNVLRIKKTPGARPGQDLNATFSYDERYNVLRGVQSDFNGKSNSVTVRGDGREIESIAYDSAGTQTFRHNATTGQLEEETSPEGVKVAYAYDNTTGYLTSITRGALVPMGFSYGGDVPGKLGRPNTMSPPRGDPFSSIKYDNLLQMTGFTRGGMQVKHAFDENGNITFLSRTVGVGRIYEETRSYGQNNFLSEVIVRGVEIDGAPTDLRTTFDPDPVFRVKKINYHDGRAREFTYDHLGHVIQTKTGTYVEDHTRDLHGNLTQLRIGGDLVREMGYDGFDRRIVINKKTGSGPDEVTTIEYFGDGEVKSITARTGGEVDFEQTVADVDGLGRPLSETTTGTTASALRSFSYSVSGGLLTTTISGPRDTTVIESDSAGRRTRVKNGLADVNYGLDANDNVEHISSDEAGPQIFTRDFTYDGLDHVLTEKDGAGPRASYTTRLDGMVTRVTDARGKSTEYDFSVLGEVITRTRPELIQFQAHYDAARMPRAILDRASAGNRMDYDAQFRRTGFTYRNGASVSISGFDNRNQPTAGSIPGGSFTASYDLQARLTSQAIFYGAGENYDISSVTFDALGRVRAIGYRGHSASFSYDKLGPIIGAQYDEPGGPYTVGATLYADGMRRTTTYPSGRVVEDDRPPNGRIEKVTVDGTVVWDTTSFAGADLPGVTLRGGGLRETNSYDARKRLLSRRYEKITGGPLVEEMRFEYDAADNVTGRQFLVRGGRGDFFEYDDANRVKRAELGARPTFGGAVRQATTALNGGNVMAPGFFARTYGYDGGGLDLLVSATLHNPTALPSQSQSGTPPGPIVPEFMRSLAGHDGYLHATLLDNANRGSTDPMGNVKSTTLLARPAGAAEPVKTVASDIKYDGLNHLVGIVLPGGVTIDYEYQPTGLVHRKTVKQSGTVLADRAFIWDQARLIEERDIRAGSTVVGRYYYADQDWPVAADLTDPATGQARRVHYLNDNVYSVVAIADDNGNVLERVSYDTWGQPLIESRDTAAPRLLKITAEATGDLLFQFTETVLPAVQPGGPGIATGAQSLTGLMAITAAAAPVAGTFEYLEDATGAQFGSVVRFRPSTPLTGNVTAQVSAAKLFDSWGNGNIAETASFAAGVPGDVFSGPVTDTSPRRIARSEIGNPILFQGQYFDYDTGLSYMRARFYDPYAGQFLQRDPLQYEDSVNLYAAFNHGPVSLRDPTGTSPGKGLSEGLQQIGKWLDEVTEGVEAERKVANAATRISPIGATRVPVRGVQARTNRVRRLADKETHEAFERASREVAEIAANRVANEPTKIKQMPKVDKATPDEFRVLDPTDVRFHAEGRLAEGDLSLLMRTRQLNDQGVEIAKSAVIRGGEQFAAIMNHFGSAVKRVKGSWSYGDNLEKFNEGIAKGLSRKKAAAATFTGRQAAKFGFTKVTIGKRIRGEDGQYTKVEVFFSKPGAKPRDPDDLFP